MSAKLVMHNQISLDGAIAGFEANLELHYRLVAGYAPGLMLVGSVTAKTGIEIYSGPVPREEDTDRRRPENPDDATPYWVIPDSRGQLHGLLHVLRRSDHCRDVIVLASRTTPAAYLRYLKKRRYDYYVAGEDRVDLTPALSAVEERYRPTVIVTDSGGALNSVLLCRGLVDEISLVVAPVIVGAGSPNLFRTIQEAVDLQLVRTESVEGYTRLVYRVTRPSDMARR